MRDSDAAFVRALNPQFLAKWCIECGDPPELYCYEGGHVSLCAHCASRLIGGVEDRVPLALAILEGETSRSVRGRRNREARPETVEFDVFTRCEACARLVPTSAAKYVFQGNVGKPHCPPCWRAHRG
jgi:hypothetical protein